MVESQSLKKCHFNILEVIFLLLLNHSRITAEVAKIINRMSSHFMLLPFCYDFRSRPYGRFRQPLELELFRVHLIFLFYSFFFSSLSDMSALHILSISNAPKYVFATVFYILKTTRSIHK